MSVFPIPTNHLNLLRNLQGHLSRLGFAVCGQKRAQIIVSDPNNTADAVRNQIAGLDPPTNRPRRDLDQFGYFADRQKPQFAVGMSTIVGELGRPHGPALTFRPVVMVRVRPGEVFRC
jgi:hypothetical protein